LSGHSRGNDLELSSLDFLGATADLQAQAQEQIREASGTAPPTSQQGADPSDSVWVSIDAEGRVEDVDISRSWRDRIEPGAFPAALFEAYLDGVRKVVSAVAVDALASQEQTGGAPGSDRPAATGSAEPPADEREWLSATWSLLEEVDEQLRRLDRINATIEARDGRRTTLTSPHGYLSARIEGPAISEITGDVQRLRVAGTEQLRLEALALFRAAAELSSTDPRPL
jgi:hypothetical protein